MKTLTILECMVAGMILMGARSVWRRMHLRRRGGSRVPRRQLPGRRCDFKTLSEIRGVVKQMNFRTLKEEKKGAGEAP